LGLLSTTYEEIHLHSGWDRVVARGLRTKNRDSKSAGWGKERIQHDNRESFAGHDKQDGDKHDDQYDVFASRHAVTVQLFCEVFPEGLQGRLLLYG
jgi:hypothetical protein